MDRKLLEKFVNRKCSPEEELEVIKWLGQDSYESALEKMISADLEEVYGKNPTDFQDLSHIREKILKQYPTIESYRQSMRYRSRFPVRLVAASVLILVTAVFIYYLDFQPAQVDADQTAINQVSKSNPRGRKSTITLPEGTTIFLNSESKITYPDQFTDTLRVIQLEGEAFFEVADDKDRPFIVRTSCVNLKVLGTSFNVKTFADSEEVSIALATGKVEVTNSQSDNEVIKKVMLKPGQAVKFNKIQGSFGQVSDFDPNLEYGWKDGLIYFNKASLEEVIEKLERWYDVKIVVENKPSNKWVYKAYHKNESLELVLRSMAHNEAFDFEIRDKVVTIKFK